MTSLKRLCGTAALAGAMVLLLAPAGAERASAAYRVTQTKTDAAVQQKPNTPTRSVPPRKRSRCYG